MTKPICAPHRNAQASPNSAGSPNRPAGLAAAARAAIVSSDSPACSARKRIFPRRRSVSNGPGRMQLIVTLCATVWRASPATNPARPVRAPFDMPSSGIGLFVAAEVMLTMRPNLRAIIPSTVALMSSIGASMLAVTPRIQSSRDQSRKSPGGGPPALLTSMSGSGQAASRARWPSGAVTSQATALTSTPVAARISAAVASSGPGVRAAMVTPAPSRARDIAQARPSPLLDAQTIALRPDRPRSMVNLLSQGLPPRRKAGFPARTGR